MKVASEAGTNQRRAGAGKRNEVCIRCILAGPWGVATKREMHAIEPQREQDSQRIGQVFVLFQQGGGDAAERSVRDERIDQFELLRAQGS